MATIDNMFDNILSSLDTKLDNLNQAIEDKTNAFDGYEKATLQFNGDGDSYLVNLNGETFQGRLSDGSGNFIDTVEKNRFNHFGEDTASNPYKERQINALAGIYGIAPNEITDEHMSNYNNYTMGSIQNYLSGLQAYNAPYDTSKVYESVQSGPVDVYVKRGGLDTTGKRSLIDVKLGNSTLATMLQEDIHLNLGKTYAPEIDPGYAYGEKESTLFDSIDRAQAAGIRFGGRLLDLVATDEFMDETKISGHSLREWSYNPEVSNEAFGVNYVNEKDFQLDMANKDRAWDEGRYGDWAFTMAMNTVPILATSLPEMATTAVGAALAPATGGGSLYAAIALNASAATANTMEEYRKNNNGKDMPIGEATAALTGHVAVFALEAVGMKGLAGVSGASKIAGKAVPSASTVGQVIKNTAKGAGIEGFTEMPQGYAQNLIDTYFSQNQDPSKKQSFLDIATSEEALKSGLEEGLVGGTFGGSIAGISNTASLASKPLSKATDAVAKKSKESAFKEEVNTATINPVKEKLLSDTLKGLDDMVVAKSTPEAITEVLDSLTDDRYTIGLSDATASAREAKVAEIVQEARKAGIKLNYNKYIDVQALDAQTVRGSIQQKLDAAKVKDIDSLSAKDKADMLQAVARETDIPLEDVEQIVSMDFVSGEVRDGQGDKKGYNYYDSRLTALTNELSKEDITEAEKTSINNQVSGVTDRLVNLQSNQVGKAEQLMEGMELLVKSKKDVLIDYTDGTVELADGREAGYGQFKINYDYVAGNTEGDSQLRERGIFALLPDILNNVSDMDAILAKHGIENTATNVDNILEQFDSLVKSVDTLGTYSRKGSKKPSKAPKAKSDTQITKTKTEAKDVDIEGLTATQKQGVAGLMNLFSGNKKFKLSTNLRKALLKGKKKGQLEPKVIDYIVANLPKDLTITFSKPDNNHIKDNTFGVAYTKEKHGKNEIVINEQLWNKNPRIDLLLHELDHIVTADKIIAASKVQSKVYQELVNALEFIKVNLDKFDISASTRKSIEYFLNQDAEVRNIIEMTAVVKSNKAVREAFKKVDYKPKQSVLDYILKSLNSLLGLSKTEANLYESVVILTDQGLDATPSVSSPNIQPDQQVVNQDLEPENQTEEQIEYTDEVPDWLTEAPVDENYDFLSGEEYIEYENEVFTEQETVLATYNDINFDDIDLDTASETVKDMIEQFTKNKIDKNTKTDISTESFQTLVEHIKTNAKNMINKGKQFVANVKEQIKVLDLELDKEAEIEGLKSKIQDAHKAMTAISIGVKQSISDLRKKFTEKEVTIPAVNSAIALETRLTDIDSITTDTAIKYNEVFTPSKDIFHLGAVQNIKNSINIGKFKTIEQYLSAYKGSIGYGNTNTSKVLVSEMNFAPALGLMFEFNEKGTPVINATTAQVVDHVILQFASSPYIFHPTGSSLDSFKLSIDDNTIASDAIKEQFLNEYGMFRSTVANTLGQQILDTLGLQNNNKYRNEYAIMVTNIGNLALTRMESLGIIKSFTSNEVRDFSGYKVKPSVANTPNTVKLMLDKRGLALVKRDLAVLDSKYLIKVNPNKKGPLKLKPRKQTEASVRKAKGTVVTKKQLSQLNSLTQVPYTVNKNIIEKNFYKDGKRNQEVINNVLATMGYEWDLDSLPMETFKSVTGLNVRPKNTQEAHDSLLGKNGAIRRELEALLDLYEEGYNGEYYFNWFIGSNTRFNMEGTDVNPQTNKHLQRALIRNAQTDIYDKNSTSDMEGFKFGLASIFDFVNKPSKDYNEAIDALLSVNPETLREALLSGKDNLKAIHPVLGIETIGHALVAVDAIEAYQKGGDVFEAELLVEHDATTSGYFIRFLQYANQSPEVLKRVGILFDNFSKTIRNLKTTEDNFLDTYETTVDNYNLPTEFLVDNVPAISQLNSLVYSTIGSEQGALLRKPEDGVITSALRKLAKPATMIFGYSAGEAKIKEETGKALLESHLKSYYKRLVSRNTDNLSKEEESFAKMMLNFAYTLEGVQLTGNPQVDKKNALNKLQVLLRTKSINEIKIRLPKNIKNTNALLSVNDIVAWKNKSFYTSSLEATLTTIYAETVGKGVYDSLSTLYEQDVDISKAYNNMYQALGLVYTKLEQEVRNGLQKQYGDKVPSEVYDKEMENLRVLMPRLKTALQDKDNDTISSEVPLIGSKTYHKAGGKTYSVRNPFAEGQSYTTTVPKIRVPKATYAKNIVTAIHGTDAVIAGGTFKDLYDEGITTLIIHDAFQTTAKNSRRVVETANKLSYETSKSYSVFEQLNEALNEIDAVMELDSDLAARVKSIRQGIEVGGKEYFDIKSDFDNTLLNVVYRRRVLFDKPMAIANIGGPEGSTYYSGDETVQEFKEVSGSTGHITPESAKRMTGKGLTSRLELFDVLAEKATESDKHLKEVRDDLAAFDDVLFDNMETTVDIVTEEFPSGTYNPKKHKINLSVPAIIDHLATVQSTAITYAHELYHAITDTVLTRHGELGASNVVRQLHRVYTRATQALDYTAFLPTRKDKKGNIIKPTARDIDLAKKAWNYVFKEGNITEFVAYAKTNESFRKALKNVELFTKEDKSSMTLLEKVVDVVNNLLKVFVSAVPFSQVFPGVSGIVTGDASNKIMDMSALQAVDHLVKQVGAINAKYIKAQNQDTASKLAYFETVKNWLDAANGYVSKHIKNLLTLSERLGIKTPTLKYKDTDSVPTRLFKLSVFVSKIVGKVLTSPVARKGAITALSRLPFGLFTGWSFVASFVRDITLRSKEGQELDNYTAMTKHVENNAMQVYGSTSTELKDAFGRELSEEENVSLTQVALTSDLSALDGYTVEQIQELAKDERKLLHEILNLEQKILNKTKPNRELGFKNYSNLLAYYMVTRVGNEALLVNATQIAKKLGMSDQVKDIDALISLKALYYTDKNLRDTFSTLPKEGVNAFFTVHNNYKKVSLDSDGAHVGNVVKGWYKTKPVDNYRTMWDLASNKDVLAKEDWTLVSENKKSGMAYYRHNYSERPTRDGSGFVSRGAYQASTAVHEFSNSSVSEKLTKAKMSTEGVQTLNRKARARFKAWDKVMTTKKLSVKQMTSGGTGLLPIMNGKGTPNWFSASLTTEERNNVLNTEQRGITVLSEMMSSFVLWEQSKPLNENLLKFLKDDQAKNFTKDESLVKKEILGTLASDKHDVAFVLLRPDSPHKYIRDYYGALPLNVRKYIEEGNELAVRQEFVAELIGVPSFALTDTKFVKAITNTEARKFMALVGTFVKELAKFVKQTIVVRMIGVVIDNILGNMSTAYMYGLNPVTVVKETFAAFRNTKEYVKDRKAFGALKMKEVSGRATDKDVAMISQLQKKMETNPVHPLMEQGLYQSIVEDLQDTSYPLTSKGIQWVQNNLLSKAPSVLEKGISQAYELEGTGIYNFLFEIVQYTDFAARAAHYKMLMEKHDKDAIKAKGSVDLVERAKVSRATISQIREIYINYNRPNSQVEQYLDDLGLFMFIKYAKRVNGVILKGIIERPISVLIGGLSQAYIMDTPDMLEGNIFARDFSNNMHTPWSNFMTAITPSLPREVLEATS